MILRLINPISGFTLHHSPRPSSHGNTERAVSGKDFIDALVNQNEDDTSQYTHLIGIPMETNHDFMLELESIQRAILYHCPLLINACIVPSLTRMPLLFIDTRSSKSNNVLGRDRWVLENVIPESKISNEDLLTSRDATTQALRMIVKEVVDETINVAADYSMETQEQRERRIRDEGRNGANNANIRPIVISFKGLEVDGEDNSVLFAIGKEDTESQRLRLVVKDIASRIQKKYGWEVAFPLDLTGKRKQQVHDTPWLWRPRVPFMRLPINFKDTLPNPKGFDGEWDFYSQEEKANYIRFPEEGGNGISPIFWYQWSEDSFCNGHGIRLKDLAVYGRTGPFGTSETAFYIPHLKVRLPEGNRQLEEDENKALNYELSRQETYDQDFNNHKLKDKDDAALAKMKSEANRRIIETIYASSSSDDSNLVEIDSKQSSMLSSSNKKIPSLVTKKKVPYKDNPIFQNWKDRKTMTYDSPSIESYKQMPPFPSNEYFVGLWRLLSSPITDDSWNNEMKKQSGLPSNENETLILRVDGTTAGGPILDFEQNLKSVGGTWRSFQAVWDGIDDCENMNTDDTERTRLRIRLVIPPKKEKILVMEGEICRVPSSSLINQNIREIQQLSTFSFPQADTIRQISNTNEQEGSLIIYCSGEMWLEAASPRKVPRKKLGSFTLVKMADPDPSQIRYSIPSNKPGYYQ